MNVYTTVEHVEYAGRSRFSCELEGGTAIFRIKSDAIHGRELLCKEEVQRLINYFTYIRNLLDD